MSEEMMLNNVVSVCGSICSVPKFSHEIFGEGFYLFNISVPRLSNSSDVLPVLVSERLVMPSDLAMDKMITIEGQYRSYNSQESINQKLVLSIFAREIRFVDSICELHNANSIKLTGFVCKKPIFRTTPSGREIADILIAVNRSYNKSDYLPCISWGRNARFCQSLKVGDKLCVHGRIQSREFQKKISDTEFEQRIAYEVSVSKIFNLSAKDGSNNQTESLFSP